MEIQQAHQTLCAINEAFNDGCYDRSLELARQLKRQMLQSRNGKAVDPLSYGWARFYEFKSLYELKQYEAAYALLNANEPVHWAVPASNAGYMYSVGSELAMHLGRPDEVVSWGERCLEQRLRGDDPISACQSALTVCNLLAMLEREDLNARFATFLVQTGRETGAERPLLRGYAHLARNVTRSGDRRLARETAAGVDALRAMHDDQFSDEAIAVIDAIAHSDWYLGALPPKRRREILAGRELCDAAREGDLDRVERLLGGGTDVDARDPYDRTPLIWAAFCGHPAVVQLLLERGAAVDAENIQRRTALVLAADQGHTEVVRLLAAAKADPNHRGICDQTALIVAAWQGHRETVAALLDVGADTEVADRTGNTALTLTATEDQPEVVRLLLERGARIEGTDCHGQTSLHKAAMYGHEAVVDLLLEHGASPAARDENGMTAADWARQEGFAALARRLGRRRRGRA
jgi:ankyrin repeat protein